MCTRVPGINPNFYNITYTHAAAHGTINIYTYLGNLPIQRDSKSNKYTAITHTFDHHHKKNYYSRWKIILRF